MTTKNIIFAATLAVVNVFGAFAQETSGNKDVFEFDSKKCQYSKIVPANKAEWNNLGNGQWEPKSDTADPFVIKKVEKCSTWFFELEAGASYNIDSKGINPAATIGFGYDFCLGHQSNFGLAVKAWVGIHKIDPQSYEGTIKDENGQSINTLATLEEAYAPKAGMDAILHLSKHNKKGWHFSLYGGVGVSRNKSLFPLAENTTLCRSVTHNTVMYNGGMMLRKRVALGNEIGLKVGFESVQTEHLSQNAITASVVYTLKSVKKSKPVRFSALY